MNARLLLILLAISVLLAFSRRYRTPGLIASGILVLLLFWFNVFSPVQQRPSQSDSSATATALQPVRTAQLIDPVLSGNGAPWQLAGRVHNTSALPVSSIQIQIERWDCPTPQATQDDCALSWQGTHTVQLSLAPHATQKFDERFYIHENVARVRGVARDAFQLKSVN